MDRVIGVAAISLSHQRIAAQTFMLLRKPPDFLPYRCCHGRGFATGLRQLPTAFLIGEQATLNQSPLIRVGCKRKSAIAVRDEFITRCLLQLLAIKEQQLLEIQAADIPAEGV